MEVTKLYNITDEIVRREGTSKFDDLFSKIITSLNTLQSNPNNPAVLEQFHKDKGSLLKNLRESDLNNMTPSCVKIAQEIGAEIYYGVTMADTIESVLSINNFNISAVVTEFNSLKTERDKYFENLKSLNSIFESFDLEMHWWSDMSKYEVGILMPKTLTDGNEVPKVTKHLNKWNQIIKDINEITGNESRDVTIAFQDIGSLEYFFQSPELTATALITGVERIAALYKKILEIRKIRQDLKKYDFPKKDQEAAASHESEVSEKEITSITEEIISEYGKKRFEGGRRNELKNALNLHLIWIARQIDKGEVVEIITPEVSPPQQKDLSDEEFSKLKIKYDSDKAKVELFKSKANIFSEISGSKNDVFRYLKSPDDEE